MEGSLEEEKRSPADSSSITDLKINLTAVEEVTESPQMVMVDSVDTLEAVTDSQEKSAKKKNETTL